MQYHSMSYYYEQKMIKEGKTPVEGYCFRTDRKEVGSLYSPVKLTIIFPESEMAFKAIKWDFPKKIWRYKLKTYEYEIRYCDESGRSIVKEKDDAHPYECYRIVTGIVDNCINMHNLFKRV